MRCNCNFSLGFAFAALVSYKDLNSSSDLLHKIRSEKSDDEERNVTYQLNSEVVTAVVSNAETKQLSEPVMLVFRHVEVKILTYQLMISTRSQWRLLLLMVQQL